MIETETDTEPEAKAEAEAEADAEVDAARLGCATGVARCRLQVASCDLKDVAFAAHLTPKSHNENGTQPRVGQGQVQE